MKTLRILITTVALISIVAVPSVMAAEQAQPASNSPANVSSQYSTEKNVDKIKLYTIEKKDDAIQKAKEAMDNIDVRMAKLGQRIKDKKAQWSEEFAKEKDEELAELKKAREEVATRYEKLKEASKKTWEGAKHAFIRSYNRLIHKLDKVKSDTLAYKEEPRDNTAQIRQPAAMEGSSHD